MPDDLTPHRRAEAWDAARLRVQGLAYLATVDLSARVPATPDWTVTDLIAHMVGVGVDTAAGTAENGHPEEWTAKTVAERRGRSLDDVLLEWVEIAPRCLELIETDAEPGLLIDLATHEQDLRGALCEPGAREGDASDATYAFYVGGFVDGSADLPRLTVTAGDRTFEIGTGPTAGTLVVDPYELQRACAGRRSGRQVRAWDWSLDPTPWVGKVSRYGALHDVDLVE